MASEPRRHARARAWILPRLIGTARACDLLLSGRIVLGEEAAALGLCNEAVPKDEVLPRAPLDLSDFGHVPGQGRAIGGVLAC